MTYYILLKQPSNKATSCPDYEMTELQVTSWPSDELVGDEVSQNTYFFLQDVNWNTKLITMHKGGKEIKYCPDRGTTANFFLKGYIDTNLIVQTYKYVWQRYKDLDSSLDKFVWMESQCREY